MSKRRFSSLGLPDHARWLVRATLRWWAQEDTAPNQPYRYHPELRHLVAQEQAVRLWDAIESDAPLGPNEWREAALLVELGFASEDYGFAGDIHAPTGLGDDEAIEALRTFQNALRGRF